MKTINFNLKKYINHFWFCLKLFLFIFLIYIIYKLINKKEIFDLLNYYTIIDCLLISSLTIFMQIVIFSYRFYLCVKLLNLSISFKNCIKSTFLGGIASNTPLSFLGGDLARIAFCKSKNIFFKDSVKVIYLDRMFGFLSLILLSIIFLPYMLDKISPINKYQYYTIVSIIIILGYFVITFLNKILKFLLPHNFNELKFIKLLAIHNVFYYKFHSSLIIFIISILATLNFSLSFYFISLSLNYNINFMTIFSTTPIIMLASMLPMFFSGWGIREFSAIYILGLFNVTADQSLVLSVIYGISLIISYFPGAFILVKLKAPKTI